MYYDNNGIIIEDWGENPYLYNSSSLDSFANPNRLYEAFKKCISGVSWKDSVQRYRINLLSNIANTNKSLIDKTYEIKPGYEFTLSERGHDRYIKAPDFYDRIVQRSLNDFVLIPAVNNYLIYDNAASQLGKGLSFARKRFAQHIRETYYTYGPDSYVLLIDFSKYFDNIFHEKALEQIKGKISFEEFEVVKEIFKDLEVDLSFMTNDEYYNAFNGLYNSLDIGYIPMKKRTGEKMMPKSVGIGKQLSQVTGILYPYKIDNYCTIVKRYKYDRYMDDTAIFAKTKEELIILLYNELIPMYNELGITINTKKTRILKITDQITYLKINYRIINGKLYQFIPNETFRREERRLKKFKNLFIEERMSIEDIIQCFLSWYGSYYKYDSKKKLFAMYTMFLNLFGIKDKNELNKILDDYFESLRNESKNFSFKN